MGTGRTDPVGVLGRCRDREDSSPKKKGRYKVHQTIRVVVVHMADSLADDHSIPQEELVGAGKPSRAAVAEGSRPSGEGMTTTGWVQREGTMVIEVVREPSWVAQSLGNEEGLGVPVHWPTSVGKGMGYAENQE
jgi:hypothetical protein